MSFLDLYYWDKKKIKLFCYNCTIRKMEINTLFLLLIFLVTAFMYSSVGHGGASGYLGIMALAGMAPETMKVSALGLNLLVSFIAFAFYFKKGCFRWKLFYPFALTSIPFSFFGSSIGVDSFWYKKILAVCLAIGCFRIFGLLKVRELDTEPSVPLLPAFFAGAVIGLFSGMIGIGGGIILSPLILLLGWGKVKETAAVSALFIFVNSFSGLLAVSSIQISANIALPFVLAALAGGISGSWWGSLKAQPGYLRLSLGVVLLLAVFKLLII